MNGSSCVIVSMLSLSAVDHWFEPGLSQTKNYEIGICCFSAKHTALRSQSKDGLARKQDNVSEWSNMSSCGLFSELALYQSNLTYWSSTKQTLSSYH